MASQKHKQEGRRGLVQGVAYLGQFAWSVIVPILLCLFGAKYAAARFGWGNGAILAGILLGLALAVIGAFGFFKTVLLDVDNNKKSRRRHDE